MTVQELYESIGGSYDSAKRILPMDQLIAKFVVKFLDDKSFEKIEAAAQTGDGSGIFEGAHAMKGVCANLGLDSLSQAASELAEEFRPGHDRTMDDAEVQTKIAELKVRYEQTMEGIRQFSAGQ